jgi:hypothetical protein
VRSARPRIIIEFKVFHMLFSSIRALFHPRSCVVAAVLMMSALSASIPRAMAQSDDASRKAPDAAVDVAVKQRLIATLPSPLPRTGKGDAPPSFYLSANLYEYMDGGADIYQLYDVETLLHWDVRTSAGDLTLDVFDMGTPENAFGMFSAESSPAYDYFPLGVAAYRNEGIVNFAQDRYYVKLAAFGEASAGVLNEYATAISSRIGGSRELPALLRKLPEAGRKPHTEQYIRKDPMGHPFLAPVYQAVYGSGKDERKFLLSVGKDAGDAAARMKQLGEHFAKTGKWQAAAGYGEGAMRGTSSFEGEVVARVKGRYVVLLLNPGTGSEAFFIDALARID